MNTRRCLVVWFREGNQQPTIVAVCKNSKAWIRYKKHIQAIQGALGYKVQALALSMVAKNNDSVRQWSITGHDLWEDD